MADLVLRGGIPAAHHQTGAIPAAADLLRWYDRHRRTMPWRALPGQDADPYHVWLSEIMLQQTTVAAVKPYFARFLARFPTLPDLAAAPSGDVMEAWAGLGYYARARNLHACAQQVAAAGGFPTSLPGLLALPGIGPYTAAAIASIAFGTPVIPVDGNVERVTSRVFAIDRPLPAARPDIARAAARLGEDPAARSRPSDFTQALFDLGATICTPKAPACTLCPWRTACRAVAPGAPHGAPASLPMKARRVARPIRHGAQFWLQDDAGRILLRRRPPKGLLGGMMELPGTEWRAAPWPLDEALAIAPQAARWSHAGQARHGFTHFELLLDVYVAHVPAFTAAGTPVSLSDLAAAALPSVMQRCVGVALKAAAAATEGSRLQMPPV